MCGRESAIGRGASGGDELRVFIADEPAGAGNCQQAFLDVRARGKALVGQVCREQLQRAGIVQRHGRFDETHERGVVEDEVERLLVVEHARFGNGGAELVLHAEVGEQNRRVDDGAGMKLAAQGAHLTGGGDEAPGTQDFRIEGRHVVDGNELDALRKLGGDIFHIRHADLHAALAGVVDDASTHLAKAHHEQAAPGDVRVPELRHGAQEALARAEDGLNLFDAAAIHIEDGEGGAFVVADARTGQLAGAERGGEPLALPRAVEHNIKGVVALRRTPYAEGRQQGGNGGICRHLRLPGNVELRPCGEQGYELAERVAVEGGGINDAQAVKRARLRPFLRLGEQGGPFLRWVEGEDVFAYALCGVVHLAA